MTSTNDDSKPTCEKVDDIELKSLAVRLARYGNSITPSKLGEHIDPLVDVTLDSFVEEFEALITYRVLKARIDEAKIAAHIWNKSNDTESFANDMNDRIAELTSLREEK